MSENVLKNFKKKHPNATITNRGRGFIEYCKKIIEDETYQPINEDEQMFDRDLIDGMKQFNKSRQAMAETFLTILKIFVF